MAEERERVVSGELARWLVLGAAILIGIGIALALGDDVEPVAPPAALEEGS